MNLRSSKKLSSQISKPKKTPGPALLHPDDPTVPKELPLKIQPNNEN